MTGSWARIPWRLLRWTAAVVLLALPWLAMRLDVGVNWTGSDFVVFGTLLALALGGYELATLGRRAAAFRVAAALALLTAFMLVWISLAVGIIGSENNPANLMFAGVLAVGIGGAIRARGRARGMAVVLFATAAAHGVAALVAAATGWAYTLIPNAVFVGLWLASGVLFRVAARTGTVSQAAR